MIYYYVHNKFIDCSIYIFHYTNLKKKILNLRKKNIRYHNTINTFILRLIMKEKNRKKIIKQIFKIL